MRKLTYLLAVAAIGVLTISGLKASDTKQKTVTAEGTLIDSKCFGMMRSNSGDDHQSPKGLMEGCATACAKQGIPVAVLQKDGKVLIVAAPAKIFAPHMGKHVRVAGMVPFEGTIIPEKIEVQSADKKWEEVKITTMM